MQEIIILLLIVILIVLVKFKNYVTDNIKKIEFELQQLRKKIADKPSEPPTVPKADIKSKPVKNEEDTWQM